MSKGISKIGRAFDKVIEKTGVKKLYDKIVPSGVRKALSKTWKKIRKPVMVAASLYLTAGLGAAAMGGTSIAGGFSTVNAGIASAVGGGGAASAASTASTAGGTAGSAGTGLLTSTGSIAGTAGATGTVSGATVGAAGGMGTGAGTGLLTSTGSIAGTAGAKGAVSGATTAMTGGSAAGSTALAGANSGGATGFFGNIKAGNYMKAATQGGKNVMSGAGKAWNAATANPGSAMLTSSVLQGFGANQQQKRQEELRNRRTWYGMDGQGGFTDFSEGQGLLNSVQAPQLTQSTSLDDLIKSRKQGAA